MRLWVTGYRSYELNIFRSDDTRIKIIKYLLKRTFINMFNINLKWIISGGQLGIEQWSLETALSLKKNFSNINSALIYPFSNFGNYWSDANRLSLNNLSHKVDFCTSISNSDYYSIQQIKNYQHFMFSHTDAALLIYDDEYPGKSIYDFNYIKNNINGRVNYKLYTINMYDLQEAADEYLYYK